MCPIIDLLVEVLKEYFGKKPTSLPFTEFPVCAETEAAGFSNII
jgi:hypothetical protein